MAYTSSNTLCDAFAGVNMSFVSRWVPTSLEQVQGAATESGCAVDVVRDLRRALEVESPHATCVILCGPPGTGKSSMTRLLCEGLRPLGCRVVLMNASCDRTAAAVAEKLEPVLAPGSSPTPGRWPGAGVRVTRARPEVVLRLEEVDSMLPEAQQAVLAHMQRVGGRLMVVATCNVEDAIVPALQTASLVLRVPPPDTAAIERILHRAAADAGHARLPDGLAHKIAVAASGDARAALRMLELTLAHKAEHPGGDPAAVLPVFRDPAAAAATPALAALGASVLRGDAAGAARTLLRAADAGIDPEQLLLATLNHVTALLNPEEPGEHLVRKALRSALGDDPKRGVALLDSLLSLSIQAARMNRVTRTALVLVAALAAKRPVGATSPH